MEIVIVPLVVTKAINEKLDTALTKCPDAAKDRDELYRKLLLYFDESGEVPDFEIVKKGSA